MSGYLRFGRLLAALVARPDLWLAVLGVAFRAVPHRWWRDGPFPTKKYLDYRGSAVYGMPLAEVPPAEFIRYVEWCKAFPGPVH